MIDSLNGILAQKAANRAVILCGGVGFAASCSNNTLSMLPGEGEDAFLFTILNVREDALELFGFATVKERDAFRLLCGVSGVGPKAALSILSTYDPDRFALLAASGDYKALTACSGIGQKLAQRIALELRDKVGDLGGEAVAAVGAVRGSSASAEAVEALVSLGFSNAEAASAVAALPADASTEQLVSAALRSLASR